MSTYEDADEVIGDALTLGEDNVVPKEKDILLPPPAQPLKPLQDAAYNYARDSTVGMVQDAMNIGKMTPEEQKDFAFGATLGLAPIKAARPKLVPFRSTPGEVGFLTRHVSAAPETFKEFNLDKFAKTGEGHLDEGHGVYLSEHPEVHNYYKDVFSQNTRFPGATPEQENLLRSMGMLKAAGMKAAPGSESQAIREAALNHARKIEQMGEGVPGFMRKELEALRKASETNPQFTRKAHEYEVHVNADPRSMMRWDEPVAFNRADVVKKLMEIMPGIDPYKRTGGSYYDLLTEKLGDSQRAASEKLREAGIPGTQYRDYNSRRNPNIETRNYAIYDPKILDIRKVWGLLGAIPGAGLAYEAVGGPSGPRELKQ